jgi:hypothetical protein
MPMSVAMSIDTFCRYTFCLFIRFVFIRFVVIRFVSLYVLYLYVLSLYVLSLNPCELFARRREHKDVSLESYKIDGLGA